MIVFILAIFNYNSFQDYLVSHLYQEESSRDRAARKMKIKDHDEQKKFDLQKYPGKKLQLDKVNCLCQIIYDICFCCCKRRPKHYKLFEQGRAELAKDLDIVNLLQRIRQFNNHVQLKVKLDYNESKWIENNKAKKL